MTGYFYCTLLEETNPGRATDPWINKYIFPNGMTPSSSQICESIEGLFVIEDWHNFGQDYDATLWHGMKIFKKTSTY